jgi:hypothetical protein
MHVSVLDVAARLGAVTAAVGLLGAGTDAPQDAFGLFQVAMNVESSAREHLPTMAHSHSFRVTIAAPGAPTLVSIFDADTRDIMMTSQAAGRPTTYIVGGTVYYQSATGAWTKFDARSAAAALAASGATPRPTATRPDDRVEVLPDRIEHGIRMGSFSVRLPTRFVGGHRSETTIVTMTCSYDKATNRLRTCNAPGTMTMTFDHYDDPANRVTLAAEALHAPNMFDSAK